MPTVLTVIENVSDTGVLVRWGTRFAWSRACHLEVLLVGFSESATEPLDEINTLVNEFNRAHPDKGEAGQPALGTPRIHFEPSKSAEKRLNTLIKESGVELLIGGKREILRSERSLTARMLDQAPCHTLLLRTSTDGGETCGRILVPVGGGPHARAAINLVEPVARMEGAEITALYVEPEIGDEASDVGEFRLARLLKEADVVNSKVVKARVAISDDVMEGIARVAEEGFDLVLLGASNEGLVRRILFSTISEKMLSGPDAISVGVVRSARPLWVRAREAIDSWLDLKIPQLEREDRVRLFDTLEQGSRWGFDFMALMALSTAIAALGLIQNAPAIVIGAMLVAPLLTPMLGAALSLVQGNVPLVRTAAKSILFGFIVAAFIGFIVGLVSPIRGLTPELLSRGNPNFLDLMVGLLSGAAAAYAVARPNLSGALPGVAIAAALVPPIAAAGVSLAIGDVINATGATFLFATNLVFIVIGAALALYAIGVRGNRDHSSSRLWVRRTTLALVLTGVCMAFPLMSMLASKFSPPPEIEPELRSSLAFVVDTASEGELLDIVLYREGDAPIMMLHIEAPEPPSELLIQRLQSEVMQAGSSAHSIEVITHLTTRRRVQLE